MQIYDSEQEQIDALKKWWRENGKTIVVGLVLGLGGVLGWTSWQNYVAQQEARASSMYSQLLNDAALKLAPRVAEQGEQLVREFPDSGYAIYAKLILAASAYDSGEADAAKGHLRWVTERATRPGLIDIAKLRLAKILAEEKDLKAALSLLDEIGASEYRIVVSEARGDMLVADQRPQEAAQAYSQALSDSGITAQVKRRIQLKLDDLGLNNTADASS